MLEQTPRRSDSLNTTLQRQQLVYCSEATENQEIFLLIAKRGDELIHRSPLYPLMTILRAAFELCCSSERQETGHILQFSKIYSKRKQTASAHDLQFLSSCYQLILNLFSIFVVNYCLCHSFLVRIHRPQKKSMDYLYLQISEDNPG